MKFWAIIVAIEGTWVASSEFVQKKKSLKDF